MAVAESPASTGTSRYGLSRLDVVVVDDSHFMLRLMQAILNSMGIEKVRCFADPTEVLGELERAPAHLLITDIMMQHLDGIALTKAIRNSAGNTIPFTIVFVLSGATDKSRVTSAIKAGAHDVLTKPISPRVLYKRIVAAIENPQDFVRTEAYFGPERRSGRSTNVPIERRTADQPASDDEIVLV